jgi:alpha-beta hydrolase superfamily lysophospholipase
MTTPPLVRTLTDSHGVEITFYEWPVSNPKAIVQIAHGLGEHARRYDHVAAALNKAGFGVYAEDHRGHGVTGVNMRAKGLIKQQGNLGPGGMPATFAAVRQLSHLIRGEHPTAQLVLLGHSWGSMIVQRLLNKFADEYDLAVLTGSTLLLPGILPSGGFNKKYEAADKKAGIESGGGQWLSRDREVGKKFRADPLNFPDTALQVFGLQNTLALLGTPARRFPHDLPLLLMAGSEDVIGGEKGNVMLLNAYKRVGLTDLELIVYEGARHEVFNETNKDEVMADLVSWLEARVSH